MFCKIFINLDIKNLEDVFKMKPLEQIFKDTGERELARRILDCTSRLSKHFRDGIVPIDHLSSLVGVNGTRFYRTVSQLVEWFYLDCNRVTYSIAPKYRLGVCKQV